MKAVFLSTNGSNVEQLALALRLRWPDLVPLFVPRCDIGLDVIEREEPDLVVICEDLPDLGVCATIQEIRRFSDVPIMVAVESTGSEDAVSVVRALDLGADEYIRMPCNLMEVMARAVSLMRRSGRAEERIAENPIRCGELVIMPNTYEAYLGQSVVDLTPTEFRLLHLLAKNRGVILKREFITRVVWLSDYYDGDTLKKYVQRLRRKLGDDAKNPTWIKTVHGVGYRFS